MDAKIKVFHVEDYKIMRDGVFHILSREENIDVVGSAASGEEALAKLPGLRVDVMIMDLYLDGMENMDAMNGFEIARAVRDKYSSIRIIAHSAYDDANRVERVVRAGASGFVSKKAGFEELLEAINTVYAGKTYFCSKTSEKLKNLSRFLDGLEPNLKAKEEIFSLREMEVLNLLAHGQSSRQIASALFITERTVESHRRNMMEKVQVRNTVELIAYASSRGLLKE